MRACKYSHSGVCSGTFGSSSSRLRLTFAYRAIFDSSGRSPASNMAWAITLMTSQANAWARRVPCCRVQPQEPRSRAACPRKIRAPRIASGFGAGAAKVLRRQSQQAGLAPLDRLRARGPLRRMQVQAKALADTSGTCGQGPTVTSQPATPTRLRGKEIAGTELLETKP